jgi:hypothetical protein
MKELFNEIATAIIIGVAILVWVSVLCYSAFRFVDLY